jgi:hypothetical protein
MVNKIKSIIEDAKVFYKIHKEGDYEYLIDIRKYQGAY